MLKAAVCLAVGLLCLSLLISVLGTALLLAQHLFLLGTSLLAGVGVLIFLDRSGK